MEMPVSGLLSSWATPATSSPIAASFSVRPRWSATFRSSVRFLTPMTRPTMASLSVADVAQGYRGRKLAAILPPVYVLADPESVFMGKRRNGRRLGQLRGRDDEIVDGKTGNVAGIVAVLADGCAIGVLHPGIDAEDQNGLVHGCERGCEGALAGVDAVFLLTEQEDVDCQRNGGRQTQQRVDMGASLQLRRFGCYDQNSHSPAAGDERDGDGRLLGNAVGIVGQLAQILDEGRLLLTQAARTELRSTGAMIPSIGRQLPVAATQTSVAPSGSTMPIAFPLDSTVLHRGCRECCDSLRRR